MWLFIFNDCFQTKKKQLQFGGELSSAPATRDYLVKPEANSSKMVVVTRNLDITLCKIFHAPPDFADLVFTMVVVVVPLALGPLAMATWDVLQLVSSWLNPHPFLRVAGDRGPHLALVYLLALLAAGSHLTGVFLAEWNHSSWSIFTLLILKYVAGSADLVAVPLVIIFGYKEVRTGVLGVYRS